MGLYCLREGWVSSQISWILVLSAERVDSLSSLVFQVGDPPWEHGRRVVGKGQQRQEEQDKGQGQRRLDVEGSGEFLEAERGQAENAVAPSAVFPFFEGVLN